MTPSGDPRPWPSIPGLVAVIGAAIAFIGFLVLLDLLPDTGARVIGVVVSALVVAAGFAVLGWWRDRPARTAGVVLSALGVLPLLVFLFIDPTSSEELSDLGLDGVDTASAILALAAVAWIVSYLLGPGRGAGFYLAAALVAVWAVLLLQIAVEDDGAGGPLFSDPSTEPFSEDDFGSDPFGEDDFGDAPFFDDFESEPIPEDDFGDTGPTFRPEPQVDPTRTGLVSLVVGVGALAVGAVLDQRRRGRPATPLTGVGVVALAVAIPAFGPELEDEGTAVLAIVAGIALVVLGVRSARRFTAWVGATAIVIGTGVLVDALVGDSSLASGLILLAVGVAVALAANALSGRVGDRGPTAAPPDTPSRRPPTPF